MMSETEYEKLFANQCDIRKREAKHADMLQRVAPRLSPSPSPSL